METKETQIEETETEQCDCCLKAVGDNIFETENGEYICQDCYETAGEKFELMYSDR